MDGLQGLERIEFADGTVWTYEQMQEEAAYRGTAGADTIVGTFGAEYFMGLGGDDRIEGGGGSDIYIWSSGDGNDVIVEAHSVDTEIDTLQLRGISTSDVQLTWNDQALNVEILSTGEIITFLDHRFGDGDGVERITFDDGTAWSRAYIDGTAAIRGTAGNDILNGGYDDDRIAGGRGDDELSGGPGSDTYVYASGDGNDRISDLSSYDTGSNRIQFTDLLASDVEFVFDGSTDLTINILGTGERIVVFGEFWYDLGHGGRPGDAINSIQFADGTTWDRTQIYAAAGVLIATEAADVLVGDARANTINALGGDDTIIGNGGDDQLYGGDGSDTYVYAIGDGNDTIIDLNEYDSGTNRIEFTDLLASDVEFVFDGSDDLTITILGTGETIVVRGEFEYRPGYGGRPDDAINSVQFADGTTWNRAQIYAAAGLLIGTEAADVLAGDARANTINALGGDDTISGNGGEDQLAGGDGSDTYVYASGDGSDTITDTFNADSGHDTLQLTDLLPDDLVLSFDWTSLLIIDVLETGQQIFVEGQFQPELFAAGQPDDGLDTIVFADGTVWDRAQIANAAGIVSGTEDADVITGGDRPNQIRGLGGDDLIDAGGGDDDIYGGSGADQMYGSAGDDVFYISGGEGGDSVFGGEGADFLSFDSSLNGISVNLAQGVATGADVGIIAISSIEFVETNVGDDTLIGSDGDDWLSGYLGNDILRGGLGADELHGGEGDDIYVFNLGDGTDLIEEWGEESDMDVLVFGAGISASVVAVASDGDEGIILTIGSNGDAIQIVHQMAASNDAVEEIRFADGTVWTAADIAGALIDGQSSDGDDEIFGLSSDDIIHARGGDDTIDGQDGDDVIYGDDGNDVLWGGNGRNVLIGGAGDDRLVGPWREGDVYVFRGQFGHDEIDNIDGNPRDIINFDTSIFTSFDEVLAAATELDGGVLITVDADRSVLLDWIGLSDIRSDNFIFTAGDIFGTGQGDQLDGSVANDAIFGLGGDDALAGNDGDDALFGGEGADLLFGATGDDALDGGNGADVMTGGLGDDTGHGRDGDDTYVFNIGDGVDVIQDDGAASETDVLLLGPGIDAVDVVVSSDGNGGVRLTIGQNGDAIRLVNELIDPEDAIEEVRFADGTVWTVADIISQIGAGETGAPDIIKLQSNANTSTESAVVVSQEAFDLVDDPEIASPTTIPHATIVATASGQGQEYYAVTVGAGAHVIFDIDHGNFDSIIRLQDGGGYTIASDDDNAGDPGSSPANSLLEYTFEQAGTYYLVVGTYGTSAGPHGWFDLHAEHFDRGRNTCAGDRRQARRHQVG